MNEYVMGIDIGTSSSKGVLVRLNGEIVASTSHGERDRHSLPRPSWAEHDAEQVWWHDFKHISAILLANADGPVIAVCVSGIGPCLLPADANGNPLRPAILYGIDTRASAEIEELTARYGEELLLQRCGSLLSSQAVGPKLLWLRRNEPEVWQQTR